MSRGLAKPRLLKLGIQVRVQPGGHCRDTDLLSLQPASKRGVANGVNEDCGLAAILHRMLKVLQESVLLVVGERFFQPNLESS